MNQLDDTLRKALAQDPTLSEKDLLEPGLIGMFIATFRGSMRWWSVLVMAYVLIFVIVGVIVTFKFFSAEVVKDQIMWATIFTFSFVAVGMLKMWWWNQMDRLAITREIKRLELRIMQLAKEKVE